MTDFHDRDHIMRYIDGELDRDEAAALEAELRVDPDLALEIAQLLAVDKSLREAFAADKEGNFEAQPVLPPHQPAPHQSASPLRWIAPMAAGACFMVIGGVLGWQLKPVTGDSADLASWRVAVQETLETQPSGTPVHWRGTRAHPLGIIEVKRTYKVSDGRYCREFRSTMVAGVTRLAGIGVACRTMEGWWRMESLTLRAVDDGTPADFTNQI
jgi:surface antigen